MSYLSRVTDSSMKVETLPPVVISANKERMRENERRGYNGSD